MALLSEGSSVKESPKDKQASVPCVKGCTKILWWVTRACFTGEEELPRCIFIVLVHTDATHGTYVRDPFNYYAFRVNKVGLKIGGQDRPFPPFECHLGGNALNYTLPLWGLLQSVQSFCREQEIGITPLNFLQRNTILGWDLTTTQLPSETTGKYTIDLIMTLETI